MDTLYEYLGTVSDGKRLTAEDKNSIGSLIESWCYILDTGQNPEGFKLTTGEKARGATGRVALNAYLMLLARKAFGKDYLDRVPNLHFRAQNLAFFIMRSNFTHGLPRGIYCCSTCTLSVFPLYCLNAFKWFNCDELKQNVMTALANNTSVFSKKYNRKYADWALSFRK